MARTILAHIVVGDPDTSAATECPDCGFDAVVTFPLWLLSANGVGNFGHYKVCARCYDEEGD